MNKHFKFMLISLLILGMSCGVAMADNVTAPAGVTGLDETSVGDTWVLWGWTDPIDSDFSHVEIWIDSSFATNVSIGIQSYNATGLSSATSYNIDTYTVDTFGNRNNVSESDTATTSTPADTTPPAGVTGLDETSVGDHWVFWGWTDPVDSDLDHVEIWIDGSFAMNVTKGTQTFNATSLSSGTSHSIDAYTVDTSNNKNPTAVSDSATTSSDTTAPGPITSLSSDIGPTWIEWSWNNPSDTDFNHTKITINGGSFVILDNSTDSYNATGLAADNDYEISIKTVDLSGNEGAEVKETKTTKILTYFSGDRIWDENAGQSTTYTWNALSYSGFFYDLESGLGSETMTIKLGSKTDRSVSSGDLEYETKPVETDFEYGAWGSYEVIGFMAEKYFAGYISNTSSAVSDDTISLMSQGHLTKVLIDSDDKESVFGGAGLVLEEGYVLNIVELDLNGDRVFVSLSKDGDEVDEMVVSSGNTYVYEKDLGDVDDVPTIAVNFAEIFSGTETSAVFIEGIFQISDEYEDIQSGDEYGSMEVDSIGSSEIRMSNDGKISLGRGDIVDIMGKLKFVVADNKDLRFAPFVDMSEPGTYELRGTIAENEGLTWTPLNFEGFYYNIDEGIGTEELNLTYTGRTIDKGDLVYSTTSKPVSFEYSGWVEYDVVGFMAEKYFAGYPKDAFGSGNNDAANLMSQGQLSKVLIDDDDKKSVFGGSSLILEEGYSLDIVEVNLDGDAVLVQLYKDGDDVGDMDVISSGNPYIYETDLGDVEDVPIIAVNFKEIFSGQESTAVFVEGIFQISDDYEMIEQGDTYGEMEVSTIGTKTIEMENTPSDS